MKRIGKISTKLSTTENEKSNMVTDVVPNDKGLKRDSVDGVDEIENSKKRKISVSQSSDRSRLLPSDLLNRIGSRLELDNRMVCVAKHACEKLNEFSLICGVSPQCVAAAVTVCCCLMAKREISMSVIAEASMCSVPNICKIYSKLRPYVRMVFPKDFITINKKQVDALPSDIKAFADFN